MPAQLEAALKRRGHDVTIANAGVSGDTSTGGLARIDWSVPDGTDAVILALGANDMLRGVEPAVTRKALDDAIRRLKRAQYRSAGRRDARRAESWRGICKAIRSDLRRPGKGT